MFRWMFSVLFFVLATGIAAAETRYCDGAEYRQFDFWIGHWDAFDQAGRLLGKTRIEKIEQACVIQEWWRGSTPEHGAGTSLTMYDRKQKIWRHVWMSARGNFAPIDGQWQDGRMIMTGYYVNDQGQRELHRTVWEPIADGVHHRWDATVDGGMTWRVIHEAWLRRSMQDVD